MQVPRQGAREVCEMASDQASWPRGLQSSGPLKACLRSEASWEWFWNTKLCQADLCPPVLLLPQQSVDTGVLQRQDHNYILMGAAASVSASLCDGLSLGSVWRPTACELAGECPLLSTDTLGSANEQRAVHSLGLKCLTLGGCQGTWGM